MDLKTRIGTETLWWVIWKDEEKELHPRDPVACEKEYSNRFEKITLSFLGIVAVHPFILHIKTDISSHSW